MSKPPELTPLDYRTPPPAGMRRVRPPETKAERRWRYWRIVYYEAHLLMFVAIAFYFGPNWVLHHAFP